MNNVFIKSVFKKFSSKEIYALLSSIGRIGNIFDTALDLPGDFAQGQVSIPPSSFNRAYFVGRAMSECMRMKKQGVLTLPNMRALLGATVGVYKTRNKNMGGKNDEGGVSS